MVITMVVVAVGVMISVVGVEGESANEGLAVPGRLSSQLSGPQDTLAPDDENKKQLK